MPNPSEPKRKSIPKAKQFRLPLFVQPKSEQTIEKSVGLSTNHIVKAAPNIADHLWPAQATEVLNTYWRFATERQAVFFRKLKGCPPPWSDDPILTQYKFTNAYRASDRVSQYLIRDVIYAGNQQPEEVFFRIILFKVFNRISTWQLLKQQLGDIDYKSYSYDRYNALLTNAMQTGQRIFSAAYIMPSGQTSFGHERKHSNYLKLIEKMMGDKVPAQIGQLRSMQALFELLRSYPLMGEFLAFQYAIDINYSELTNFSEMEFVVPGPGAREGIRKCFRSLGGLNEIDLIRIITERQDVEFARLGLKFDTLFGRPLQLIDCQNLFCEVDKYARRAHPDVKGKTGRTRIKQNYHPVSEPLPYWYPPKWGINHLISTQGGENATCV
jgi:alpha-glutamyl/putrescinyl thymine pyrophosphorylase clade 1